MKKRDAAGIRATGLTKRYDEGRVARNAVSDVSLAIPSGEFWVLRGPSGSGKTTLLGMLAGMIAPTKGEVWLGGKSITHLRDHHRAVARRHLVGMVFQEVALVDGMTLQENVLLPLVPGGGARRQELRRADELLKRFGLKTLANTRVDRLSGGERQRGAIVRSLVMDTPILMLDEPTAHLDTESVRLIQDLLLALRAEGRTILIATHDPRLADDKRIDAVLTLVDGTLRN